MNQIARLLDIPTNAPHCSTPPNYALRGLRHEREWWNRRRRVWYDRNFLEQKSNCNWIFFQVLSDVVKGRKRSKQDRCLWWTKFLDSPHKCVEKILNQRRRQVPNATMLAQARRSTKTACDLETARRRCPGHEARRSLWRICVSAKLPLRQTGWTRRICVRKEGTVRAPLARTTMSRHLRLENTPRRRPSRRRKGKNLNRVERVKWKLCDHNCKV